MLRRSKSIGQDSERSDPKSHTNYRFLTTPEKNKRMQRLHQQNRTKQQHIDRLKTRIEKAIDERGIEVDNDLHSDIWSKSLTEDDPQGSFARASPLKDTRSMKWHPLMIRWCLYLRHLSSSSYDMIHDAGVITLPSQRTLYILHQSHNWIFFRCGQATHGCSKNSNINMYRKKRSILLLLWTKCM